MKYIIVIITFFLSYAVIAESGFVIIQNQIKDHIQKHEYEEAKELKNQYLNSANKSLPYQSKEFAIVLSDLSLLYEGLGDYDQAIKYQEEILEIYTDIKDYYGMAISLNNLSSMNNDLGKFSISIDYAVQSIDLLIKHYGDDTQYLVEPLISRGVALQKKGNYLESIEFFQKATSIELANRKRDSVIANISNNIGVSFSYAGNYAEAVQYYTKAIEIRERIFGSNDPSVAGVLNSLGQIYVLLNELDLAERTLLRGLYIREKNFGDDHLLTIRSKMNLSIFYNYSGQGEKGAETLEGVIDPLINQFGFYHPETYKTFIALSSYYSGEGDNFEKSEEYGLKALEIGEKILDPLDDYLSTNYLVLSRLYFKYQKYALSHEYSLQSAKLASERNLQNSRLAEELDTEIDYSNILFHVENLVMLKSFRPEVVQNITYEDSFELIQSITEIKASKALKKASLRLVKDNKKLSVKIKTIQDLEYQKQSVREEILNNFVANKDINESNAKNQQLENKILNIDNLIKEINSQLESDFPQYFNLILPQSSSINEIQELIQEDESLLSYIIDEEEGFIILVHISSNHFDIKLLDYNYEELKRDVASIRNTLSAQSFKDFDFATSFKMYDRLIKPIEDDIQNHSQLIIVPDKELFKIPFSVLVNMQYSGPYKKAPWLINDYALVNLPSINSLKYLHKNKNAKKVQNSSFVGFGDPVLDNYQESNYRGVFKNVKDLKKLGSLPETREELTQIANILGQDKGLLYLGKEATEENFKNVNFDDFEIILFATHGLISGELKDLQEPALVLTPPPEPTNINDGILTASEIASMNLPSIDWVILSACNTSSGEKSDAEELSGLAKSFFYAGAKSILVSHWPVESQSAVDLTTGIFQLMAEQNITKGKALQLSMKNFIQNTELDSDAHPIYWAPFMLVGSNN